MSPEYPGSFNTPAFPAGRRIAVSRAMGVGILTAFFVIACLCGLLMWGVRSMRLDPFLISTDNITGTWSVIGRSTWRGRAVSVYDTMQEAVAGNFFQSWFYISDSVADNNMVWSACPIEECSGAESMTYGDRKCAISCAASADLYDKFIEDVMEGYHRRSSAGETWGVMTDTIQITPIGDIDAAKGGVWRVQATVWSNINAAFNVVAFVRIARSVGRYPMTMGYYVSDFNAYRIN